MIKPSILVLAIGLCASSAMAQGFEASIVDQLRREGYAEIRLNTTFLGRVRILAMGDKGQREIVLNPRTGEVLRDLWHVAPAGGGGESRDGGPPAPPPQGPPSDDRGRNGGGDDRPSDDRPSDDRPSDDRGDDDRDDNSGSRDDSGGGGDDGGQGRGRGRGGDGD